MFDRESLLDEILQKIAWSGPRRTAPFAAEGGKPYTPNLDRDPFEVLDELMAVVEALAPRWPERKPDVQPGRFEL